MAHYLFLARVDNGVSPCDKGVSECGEGKWILGFRAPKLPPEIFEEVVVSLFPLRPLQQKALDGLRESLRQGSRRPIIQAPTGFGKTICAAHIAAGALAKGKRPAFVVPMINLIDQTFERFTANGIEPSDMGVMQGSHPWRRVHAPLQICSVQTLAKRGFPESIDVWMVDEVHLRFKAMEKFIKQNPQKIFVGFSATPWSAGLGEVWDDLIIPTTTAELIEAGYLSSFRAFAAAHPDLSGIKTVAGDYHEGQLAQRMSSKSIVGDVVHTWLEKAERRPTLLFAVNRAHAQLIHDQFEEMGVSSAYVDAMTPREERSEIGKKLNGGRIEVICSVGTMTTGVDLDVRCIVMARPTKSEMLFVQMIGRGLRTAEGKKDCIILDHSDNHLRLGMVTDIHHDFLDCGGNEAKTAAEKKPPLPRECPACSALIPPGAKVCLSCGFEPKKAHGVEHEAGELVELETARKTMRKANHQSTWAEKAQFYGELRYFAREKGYKDGWASSKYREKFGVWPNDERVRYAPIQPCGVVTRSWIRSRQIAWSKGKERRSTDEIIRKSVESIDRIASGPPG